MIHLSLSIYFINLCLYYITVVNEVFIPKTHPAPPTRPLEDNIGQYDFVLEAIDSEGATATDNVSIKVHQSREARTYNHRFTATLKMEKKFEYEFVYSLDWQVLSHNIPFSVT